MKILHINCNYLTTALHQTMIEMLDKTGVESIVFVPTYDKSNAIIKPNKNVVISQCFRKIDRLNYFYKQAKIIHSIEEVLDIAQFDCIHAYTVFTDGNCAMELSRKYHIPYVTAVRNTDVNTFFKYMPHLRKRGIEILGKASAVFFLSPSYEKRVLLRYAPETKREKILSKSHIVPNGIDNLWFQNGLEKDFSASVDRLRHKKLKAIYVGRINRNKNITTAQRALSILKDNGWNVEFTVVGNIDEKSEYRRIIKDENTKYLPERDMMKLIELYKEYDVFIMPSHKETFGLVYAEAMSQGLPVIYTKNQGFDGQFPEGEVGYAVDDKDADSIAEAIRKIVESYETISKNSVACAKKFNWKDICEMYKQFYCCVTSNRA